MKLVPLSVVLGQDDDQSLVGLIEARWRDGKIPGPVLGRRDHNHMHEEIENYHRLEILWCAAAPKRDYYEGDYDSEAYAHPPLTGWSSVGADYYSNIWKDVATTERTLSRLRTELKSAPVQPEVLDTNTSKLGTGLLNNRVPAAKEISHRSIAASDMPESRHWKMLGEAVGCIIRRRGVLNEQAWAMLKADIATGEIKARCCSRRYDPQQARWIETWRDLDPRWLGFIAYECPQDNHLRFDPADAIRARMLGEQLDLPPEHARGITVEAARLDGLYPVPENKPSPPSLDETEAATKVDATARKPVARRPSRQKPFWSDARKVAFDWLDEHGYPVPGDGGQARLEEHINTWLTNRGHTASESTIREHVSQWIEEYKAGVSGPH
jgi:hypothetical protein